ncbi:hypothetical protein PFISCL1PPCAC_24007, partial [Pristionchus fissidentatus]
MDASKRRLLWRMSSEKSYPNSTSCLVRNNAEAIAVANAVVPPRHSSTEGRFSILDSHAKSSDSESDFDSNQPPITFSRRVIAPNFSKSVDFSAGTTNLPMSTSVSRFRIVPLESRYKRGRWTCYDYYEKTHLAKNAKLSLPATKNKSFDINNLSVRSLNEVTTGPKTAPPNQPLHPIPINRKRIFVPIFCIPFMFSPKTNYQLQPSPPAPSAAVLQQHTAATAAAAAAVPKVQPVTILTPPSTLPSLNAQEIRTDDTRIISAVKAVDLGQSKSLCNGRLTPTEMLQSGLETTLNTCSEAIGALVEKKVEKKKRLDPPLSLSPPLSPPRSRLRHHTSTAPVITIAQIATHSALPAPVPASATTADADAVQTGTRPASCASLASIDFATPPNTPTTASFAPIFENENTPSAPAPRIKPPLIVVCEWDEGKERMIVTSANNTGKELRTIFGEQRRAQRSSSSASTVTSTGGNPSMVAIDSKIEQAMDLVKTHLMFAVREEVEVLRGRIVDLENTVCNLEAENAVLRQHVSDEILRNMN